MKAWHLLLITSLACMCIDKCHADNFAQTDNMGKGKIVIRTEDCGNKLLGDSKAYYYTAEGITEDGCWKYDGDTIVIVWEKDGRRRYPISYFELLNEYHKFRY